LKILLEFSNFAKKFRGRKICVSDWYQYVNHEAYITQCQTFQKLLRKVKHQNWQAYSSNCLNPSQTSKLAKQILTRKGPPISLTFNNQGHLAKTGQEAIQNLIDVHFPGSLPIQPDDTSDNNGTAEPTTTNTTTSEWITDWMVKSTIATFKQDKAAGPDTIKVQALKQLPQQIYSILANIYNKSLLTFGYMPKIWCMSKAIFLPKPGKKICKTQNHTDPSVSQIFFSKPLKK
jgi:hypothetical protein